MFSVRTFLSLPLFLAVSCTGYLTDEKPSAGDRSEPNAPGVVPENRTGSFQGPIISEPRPTSRLPRLNHRQWENTVRDLLRVDSALGISDSFVAEPLRGTFDTNGSILSVSADLFRDYQTAAETVAARVAQSTELLAKIVPTEPTDPVGKARAFIEDFGLRAYRRPLTDAEIARLLSVFDEGPTLIGSGDAFTDGVELVVSFVLQSPYFLYRAELATSGDSGKIALTDHEIATRLSYALTNSMPDDVLFAAAANSELHTRDAVIAQANRLLDTAAAQEVIADFHAQLLSMSEYDNIAKDSRRFPEFGEGVGADIRLEALSFVNDVVLAQELGLYELLTAPYTFANSRIGQIYGLDMPTPAAGQPDPFIRVDLGSTERAGLLTQIGFLAANGEGEIPNIIMRGVHIARKILCVDLPAPPNNVPPLPTLEPNMTNRQRVQELTKESPCSGCHTELINPPGFAFENLDGLGRYRTEENGLPIDATGSYKIDGEITSFDGAVEFISAIAASKQAHDCYARHWVEYLYGRDVDIKTDADLNLIRQGGWLSSSDSSVKNLIVNLLATDAFLTRLP